MMLWVFLGAFMCLMIWCGICRAGAFSETKWERASADWIRKWHNNKPFSPADYRKEEMEIAALDEEREKEKKKKKMEFYFVKGKHRREK